MNSLRAFLAPCEIIHTEGELRQDKLSLLIENGQPAQIFDRDGQPQVFQVVSVANPELLTKEEVATLATVAQQAKWIVIVDHSGQVRGIIDPESNEELLIAAKASIQQGELGSAIAPPLPSGIEIKSTPALNLLGEWWHQILREYKRYRCYAFFLCLPSDRDAIEYITKYGKELDVLSGENCLVVFLSKAGFRRMGYDKTVWNFAINEHIQEGYSVTVANLLKINYTDFPCLALFGTLDSPKRVVFSFKGLDVDRIARQVREIFTTVQQAVASGKDPILTLERCQSTERLRKIRAGIVDRLGGFAGRTFEVAMEALIKASLQ